MKAVKNSIDTWPVTHPVIRAALWQEDVCPDCGRTLDGECCPKCGTERLTPRDIHFG